MTFTELFILEKKNGNAKRTYVSMQLSRLQSNALRISSQIDRLIESNLSQSVSPRKGFVPLVISRSLRKRGIQLPQLPKSSALSIHYTHSVNYEVFSIARSLCSAFAFQETSMHTCWNQVKISCGRGEDWRKSFDSIVELVHENGKCFRMGSELTKQRFGASSDISRV